jgi:hypothetical protein
VTRQVGVVTQAEDAMLFDAWADDGTGGGEVSAGGRRKAPGVAAAEAAAATRRARGKGVDEKTKVVKSYGECAHVVRNRCNSGCLAHGSLFVSVSGLALSTRRLLTWIDLCTADFCARLTAGYLFGLPTVNCRACLFCNSGGSADVTSWAVVQPRGERSRGGSGGGGGARDKAHGRHQRSQRTAVQGPVGGDTCAAGGQR